MKTAFIIISSVFAIASILPYISDVLKKKTKPRIVSWLTWSLLTAIASAASFSDKQYASAILTLIAAIETMTVVVLGYKHGDRKFNRLDVFCLRGVFVGLGLWAIFRSPAVAIIAILAIDFVGTIPTIKHSWQSPHEETTITYILGLFASIFTLLAAKELKITAVAFPLYLVLADLTIVVILLTRHKSGFLKTE